MKQTLSAVAAAQSLGVSRATLYSYVSRGMIRSHPHPIDPRKRLYRASDVQMLKVARERGHKREEIASKALNWGTAALPSKISLVQNGWLYYRGRDAIELAQKASLEEVATLLWDGPSENLFENDALPNRLKIRKALATFRSVSALNRATGILSLTTNDSEMMWGRDRRRNLRDASGLLRLVAGAILGIEPDNRPIHTQIASHWNLSQRHAETIRAALILSADHELNASTFAARVVASTGASLSACVVAGLSALSGPLHGGAMNEVAALFDEAQHSKSVVPLIEGRINRGERVPGFGHALYPDGDPRAEFLLAKLSRDPLRTSIIKAVEKLGGAPAYIDFALVALGRLLALPSEAPLEIFAIGRATGWIAHALEQHADGKLIRPRAKYVGICPKDLANS